MATQENILESIGRKLNMFSKVSVTPEEFQKAFTADELALFDEIEKGGEGSRGGKIIGHTKSGKPIYEDHKASSKHYRHWTAQDHKDAGDHFKAIQDNSRGDSFQHTHNQRGAHYREANVKTNAGDPNNPESKHYNPNYVKDQYGK